MCVDITTPVEEFSDPIGDSSGDEILNSDTKNNKQNEEKETFNVALSTFLF